MKRVLVWLAEAVIRGVGATLRMTVEDRAAIVHAPDHPPIIMAFWHNRVALMPYIYQRFGPERTLVTFISASRDGQFITEVAARFGVRAVRGSSSRKGTVAALGAMRIADDPRIDLAITPDGPRGPCYHIQPGLLRLAQTTGRPIVAVTYTLGWVYRLKSWDRFQVPLPFSRCRIRMSEPIAVPPEASPEELGAIMQRIADALGGD